MTLLTERLNKLDACDKAILWIGNLTPEAAWKTCKVGAWMQWIVVALTLDDLYRHDYTHKLNKSIRRALRQKNTGLTPAERIRQVVTYKQVHELMLKRFSPLNKEL